MRSPLTVLFCFFLFMGCNKKVFNAKWANQTAPEYFKARFETSKGNFVIESYRKWSPKAVDRLYQLIKTGYYSNAVVYRVEPKFVVQWGRKDSLLNNKWEKFVVDDEPVILSNKKGVMSFARLGKETRSHELFINLEDNNPRLDTIDFFSVKGFPGVAIVIEGFDVVRSFIAKADHVRKAYLLKTHR